jgi:dolichol-phosphate mannosyltransferase
MNFVKNFVFNKQFIRFVVSGGTAAIFGMLVIYLLTEVFHVWYLISSIVAFLVSFLVAFSLQKFWTFDNKSLETVPRQMAFSLVLAGLNFLINAVLMFLLVDQLHLHYFLSQLLVYGFFAIFDFFIYKAVIFKS